jgi:hypothetical protein
MRSRRPAVRVQRRRPSGRRIDPKTATNASGLRRVRPDGRRHTHPHWLARQCDALLRKGLRLAPDRGVTCPLCTVTRSGVAGDPTRRSIMRGWSACPGGFRAAVRRDRYPANRVGSLHPPPRGEHPTPDERAPMTVARGHRGVGVGSSIVRPRHRHQLASDRPEREE